VQPLVVLAILASAALGTAGCSGPPPAQAPVAWQKPGTDQQTVARDTSNCRVTAQAEALRQYPHGGGYPGLGAAGVVASQQQDDANRTIVEAARFNDCMLGRGYKRG
jgi:hypothetical protein